MRVLREISMKFTPARQTALLLFIGLSGFYLSLSPAAIAGQGYTGEEIDSGTRMLAVANAWIEGRPIPPMVWSRHGPIPVLFDLPFIKLGETFVSSDFMLSFQPVLLTAAIVTVLYLWLRKLCSPGMSLLLTVTGAFGTMLWPYAYISLETKQSFFVLLAGYLALAEENMREWTRILLFAIASGLAVTVKATGIVLFPAIAYLAYIQLRDDWRSRRTQVLAVLVVIGAIWSLGALSRGYYWGPRGGGLDNLRPFLIDSPFQIFTNVIGIFGSPMKGLFVYAPVLLVSLYAIPRAFRTHRHIVMSALLVTGGTVVLLSALRSPADEVWGCRYMHVAIAPLLVCLGAAWPRFEWRKHATVAVLAAVGVVISFLGAFYYYGLLDLGAKKASQNTVEWITGDYQWDHIQFNARLLRVWLSDPTTSARWTPKHIWMWTPPPNAQTWETVDLRELCQPQSFMVRFWNAPKPGIVLIVFRMYVTSLLLGLVFLTGAVLRTLKEHRNASARELAVVADCTGNL